MAGFLERLRKRPDASRVLELLAVEGDDRGERFTLDAAQVRIGRGRRRREPGRIALSDATVSQQQARLERGRDGRYRLRAEPGTTNPTLLNDRPPGREPLRSGDRIRMGRVLLEVRGPAAMQLSTLEHPLPGEQASLEATTTARIDVSALLDDAESTQARRVRPLAELELLAGFPDGQRGRRIPIRGERVRLGRSAECEVRIEERGVSRVHAEIEWRGASLHLLHRSRVNPTLANGRPVEGECKLASGDRIQLADRVLVAVHLGADAGTAAGPDEPGSLQSWMEQKIERDALIEQRFRVEGSFLDVDIVDSYGMKAREERDAHIIVSFERFRAFVATRVVACGGHVLNSNGDELMCFFDRAADCVAAARELLAALPAFNAEQNLLRAPFRVRLGAHTGESLVDKARGVAYSEVLDVAGHLQKQAEVNGLRISEATWRALPKRAGFEPDGVSERDEVRCYRLVSEEP